jgi:hypothetical protein
MSNKEREIQALIDKTSVLVSESKKRLSDIKKELLDEETILIELTIRFDALKEMLRKHTDAHPLNESEEKNTQVDAAFKAKLESLLTSVK